jgi:hypothetical protein
MHLMYCVTGMDGSDPFEDIVLEEEPEKVRTRDT